MTNLDHEGYRFRFRCDPCREFGEFRDELEQAREDEAEHIETHDELLYEPTRIQRYPEDELPPEGR